MNKKTLYAFIVSFVLLIAVIILNRFNFRSIGHYTERVDHTRVVIGTFEQVSNHLKSAQIYTPAFDSGNLKNFYRLLKQEGTTIRRELTELRALVQDMPSQVQLVDSLRTEIEDLLPELMRNNITELIQKNRHHQVERLYNVHLMIDRGIAKEKTLLEERRQYLESRTRQNNLLTTAFGVLAVGIILVTFLSNFFIARKHRWLEGFTRSILDTSRSGVVHFLALRKGDQINDFQIGFLNRAAAELMGTTTDNALGGKLSELPHGGDASQMRQQFEQVVESGEPAEFEIAYRLGTETRYFLVSLTRMDDGVIASFNNITQLKHYEEELKENIAELERSNRELEQYAYIASHDLQEPLRKIRSFGSYLIDTQGNLLNDKGRQQLDKIMASAERMSMLIRDLLSYSSMRKEDLFNTVDLNEILSGVRQDLELVIEQRGARVESEELPAIEAIPLQMTQLFHNLVSNGIKFAREEEPPQIRIRSRELPASEKWEGALPVRYIELRFSDNGIGFQQEYAGQIFGLFKRLNNKNAFPGSGIGLALCKKVVENHHGSIRAESTDGHGATFIVCLPVKQVH